MLLRLLRSPIGTKRTCPLRRSMSAFGGKADMHMTPSVAGTGRYGAAGAGYRTSIGGIERFPDGIRDRAGANNRRLGHD